MRKLGFTFALVFTFLRFSMLHETLAVLTGIHTYLVLLAGVPAIFLAILGGGLPRVLQHTGARYWFAFLGFMALSVLFSSWRGESAQVFSTYVTTDFPTLLLLGGMIVTWKECKRVVWALALSAVSTIGMQSLFASATSARLAFNWGTIGNANDYAAHLILLLPFLLCVVLTPSAKVLKLAAMGLLVLGLFVVLKTGSRGGLIAIGAGMLMILVRGSGRVRWILGCTAPLVLLGLVSYLPSTVTARYGDIFGNANKIVEDTTGAEESLNARRYLLVASLEFTLHHPLFGVGPGTFSDNEGAAKVATGGHGQWQETHNSYTQISSEVGIPAVLCYLVAILYTFLTLNRIIVTSRRQNIPVLAATAFCCMLSLTTICIAMLFLSLAYRFYLPALSGLAFALDRVMRMEFLNQPAPVAAAVSPFPERFTAQPSFRPTGIAR
jgi:O-antigen ligase